MITLEQYANLYMPLMTAYGNEEKEKAVAAANGLTYAALLEAKAFYMARMTDPADMGKTAMAIASAAQRTYQGGAAPKVPAAPKSDGKPADFTAANLTIDHSEFDVLEVTWNDDRSDRFLMIQMAYESDEAEKANGMDTYHIEINEQSYSMYGGVTAVDLKPDVVTFYFDEAGKERMQCPSITIRYKTDGKKYAYLLHKMRFIFEGVKLTTVPFGSTKFLVNGLEFDDAWVNNDTDNTAAMKLSARPHLQNMQATGRYNTVVFIDWKSATIGKDAEEKQLMDAAEAALKATLERDLSSVMAFTTTGPDSRRYYIYTSLEQGDFMAGINDALRMLPRLPLAFSGGEDAEWANYKGCLEDLGM